VNVLRIAVGFKVTPDYEALRPSDWAKAAEGRVETRYVRRVLNCFDESALELALRLRDDLAQRGLETRLAAFSVAGREADPFLETLRALGYHQAARAEPEAALDFAPGATAALVAAFARRVARCDLLLLGSRSGPGDGGTVPVRVAEALGWPYLAQVVELEPLDGDGRLRVTCEVDEGLLRVTLRPPCVLAVGNAVVSRLRVPTLTDRLGHRGDERAVLTTSKLGVDTAAASGDGSALAGLEVVSRDRAGVVVAGATPAEKARALYDGHLRERLEAR
jgi:electron transfer flavoprotein beta subunit